MNYPVAEKFVSINGEGAHAGELAAFIRFRGCNLNCSYCDTKWANGQSALCTWESAVDLTHWVRDTGVINVTLTGGEPLLQDVRELCAALIRQGCRVEIETNGSVDLSQLASCPDRPVFTMDYKLPSSGMEGLMNTRNFSLLSCHDSVKFVVGSTEDLNRAKEIIDNHLSNAPCHIFFSPVFGSIEPVQIVEFMIRNHLTQTRIQLQLHKFIWDPNERGV